MISIAIKYYRSVPKSFRHLWVIIIFRFVPLFDKIIGLILLLIPHHIYKFWYNFDTVLYQFHETGTSDRTKIGHDQFLKYLDFDPYPLSFYLNSPLKIRIYMIQNLKYIQSKVILNKRGFFSKINLNTKITYVIISIFKISPSFSGQGIQKIAVVIESFFTTFYSFIFLFLR